jgi:hypothetical protein
VAGCSSLLYQWWWWYRLYSPCGSNDIDRSKTSVHRYPETPSSSSSSSTTMPPSSSVTSLLNSIRSHPYLPHHTWYLLAGVTYSSLNRADRIPLVFQHALETGPGTGSNSASAAMQTTDAAKVSLNEQRAMARRMREALIKGAVIGGLPKVRRCIFCRGEPFSAMNATLNAMYRMTDHGGERRLWHHRAT